MKLKLYNASSRNNLVNLNEGHVASIDNFLFFFLNWIHKIWDHPKSKIIKLKY